MRSSRFYLSFCSSCFVQRTENVTLGPPASNHGGRSDHTGKRHHPAGTDRDSTGVSLFGGAVLLWGTLRIFRGLDTAFSDIYESGASNTFGDQLNDGLVLLVTVAVAILSASALGSVLPETGSGPLWTVASGLVRAAGLFVVFYPMYYIFPDTDVSPLEAVPGVAFPHRTSRRAGSLHGVQTGSTNSSVVAGILVLLTWLYFSGLVILLGAAVNAVLSNRSADVNIEPVVRRSFPAKHHPDNDDVPRGAAGRTRHLPTVFARTGDNHRRNRRRAYRYRLLGTATVDRSSDVLGLDQSVALTLRWWPNEP
ncbi:hypothetical protein C8039_06390 [Halogeometricum sp. wsp3]|nr:hypothetical protein C8039_06390 [Halogeometricum sp. wsp3]